MEKWGHTYTLDNVECVGVTPRRLGTPEPRIQVEPGELWFEFSFSPTYLDSISSGTSTQETTQEQIMTLLRKEPTITRKALANRIGITSDGIKYHLAKLKKAEQIRHVGPTNKGHWEILGDDGE